MWMTDWRREGKEPDYRFSLANERTFLAWIRTAMAVLAGGVVLDQFATRLGPPFLVLLLATGLAGAAGALSVLAFMRWRANEIAMRHSRPLPAPSAIALMCGTALLAALAIGALIWLR